MKREAYLRCFLIFVILFGVLIRFYDVEHPMLIHDESIFVVGGIKMHYPNPYDPRLYDFGHPPLGRWFTGLPTKFVDVDYGLALSVPAQMFVYTYMAPYKDVFIPLRLGSAVYGIVVLLLIYLITAELFGMDAGLWSTALAALSFDLLYFSRLIWPTIVVLMLALATIYFYVKYIQAVQKMGKNKVVYLLLTFFFFTITLGSRSFTPMFLIPVLLVSQILIFRGEEWRKENMMFISFLVFGFFIWLDVIYPAPIRKLSQQTWGVQSPLDILGFSFFKVIKYTLSQNSYLFAFGAILVLYEGFLYLQSVLKRDGLAGQIRGELQKNGKTLQELKSRFDIDTKELEKILKDIGAKRVKKGKTRVWLIKSGGAQKSKSVIDAIRGSLDAPISSFVLVVYSVIAFLGFSVTKYVGGRYLGIYFLPLFILAGKVLNEKSRDKKFLALFIILILINIFQIIMIFPYFGIYSNFRWKYNQFDYNGREYAIKNAISYLNENGKPPIITNEFNTLVLYEGNSVPLIASYEDRCSPEYLSDIMKSDTLILYDGGQSSYGEIRDDPYTCQYIRSLPMKLVKEFKRYTEIEQAVEEQERSKLKLYRVEV